MSTIPAAVICDAKNMYDAVTRIVSSGLQLRRKTFEFGSVIYQGKV